MNCYGLVLYTLFGAFTGALGGAAAASIIGLLNRYAGNHCRKDTFGAWLPSTATVGAAAGVVTILILVTVVR